MGYNKKYIKAKEKIAKLHKQSNHKKKAERVPPGQYVTPLFPILDLGIKPDFDPKSWRLHIHGLVDEKFLTYEDILKMPSIELTEDFHCVTSWSRFDVKWKGVPFKKFLEIVKPSDDWKFLIQESSDGYTTNVKREDLEKNNVVLVYELDGKPIPREHGWPMRIIIPHLYGWKSAKFLTGLKFTDKDEPGFWEVRGYHNRGNVWEEERYSD